jgi:hypothetical protein
VANRYKETPNKEAINQFKVGDILQISFNPHEDKPDWVQFFPVAFRNQAEVEWGREIVETHGACLGVSSAKLAIEISSQHHFRTVTP